MNNLRLAIAVIVVCSLLAGCAPQESIFPLFSAADYVFESEILGEWQTHAGPQNGTSGSRQARINFKRVTTERNETLLNYEVEISVPTKDKQQVRMISICALARLGTYLFLDLQPSEPRIDDKRMKATVLSYPTVPAHVFGRVELGKDSLRMAFLSDKWVRDQAKAGTLAISHLNGPDGVLLTAKTEELRKFALERAEDRDVFSESFVFYRGR